MATAGGDRLSQYIHIYQQSHRTTRFALHTISHAYWYAQWIREQSLLVAPTEWHAVQKGRIFLWNSDCHVFRGGYESIATGWLVDEWSFRTEFVCMLCRCCKLCIVCWFELWIIFKSGWFYSNTIQLNFSILEATTTPFSKSVIISSLWLAMLAVEELKYRYSRDNYFRIWVILVNATHTWSELSKRCWTLKFDC